MSDDTPTSYSEAATDYVSKNYNQLDAIAEERGMEFALEAAFDAGVRWFLAEAEKIKEVHRFQIGVGCDVFHNIEMVELKKLRELCNGR